MVRKVNTKGSLWSNDSATTAISFAVGIPLVFAAVGVAIDGASMTSMQSRLQVIADTAALSAAHEFALPKVSENAIKSVVHANIAAQSPELVVQMGQSLTINKKQAAVRLELTYDWKPRFGAFIGIATVPLKVSTTAQMLSKPTGVCVLALKNRAAKGIHLEDTAAIKAESCGVYANSNASEAIRLDKSSSIAAKETCSAGGIFMKSRQAIQPEGLTDCPVTPDPLANRASPSIGSCDHNDLTISGGTVLLSPGVFCGGISITGSAKAHFEPGTYVILDGPLKFADKSVSTGTDIGFFLTGGNALLECVNDATIRFSGPESGELAGLLLFEDRTSPVARKHKINCTNAHELVGTIYLPRGALEINQSATIADQSAFTSIIAHELILLGSPNLVLNSDYQNSAVPLPEGARKPGSVIISQ